MINLLWMLLCSGLVFLMQAGFMCLESGLTRSKNSINVAVKNMADFAISVALFWLFGYALMFGNSVGGWVGITDFLFNPQNNAEIAVFFIYQAMFCGTATTIISGAVAERLKFSAYLLIAGLVSGLIYPLFGHWSWHGIIDQNAQGWLRNLGFVDFAGSTVVHSIGAWVGLATLVIIGSRRGRYDDQGGARKIQGSNLPFSVLGAFILWFGWIGFNGGSSLAFNAQVPLIVLNTLLAGVAGMIAATGLSLYKFHHLAVEWLINGAIAGLVAITACCHVVTPFLAVIVGMTGAAVMILTVYGLERYRIDDAVDAVAVHGGAGMWGTLCVALFGQLDLIGTNLSRIEQLGVQLLGIGVAGLWAFGVSWIVLSLVNRVFYLRVSPQEEELGLNISEHRAKTDTYDLFQVMDAQAHTQNLSLRVPVEPFTEVGHIATRYNQVMDSLELNHRQNVEYLERIYDIVAITVSALETNHFSPKDLDEFVQLEDEVGTLAQVLQQLMEQLSDRRHQLSQVEVILKESLCDILILRFGEISPVIQAEIVQIEDINFLVHLLQQATRIDTLDQLKVNN